MGRKDTAGVAAGLFVALVEGFIVLLIALFAAGLLL
jgi:hypothetical protein